MRRLGDYIAAMTILTNETIRRVRSYLPGFYEFLKTEKGRKWLEERLERIEEFSKLLAKEALKGFTEADFIRIMSRLWANMLWANKQYPAERVLSNVKIEELRSRLSDLLWADKPLAQRYDEFRKAVKGMGPAQITEILSFINPTEYGIWNRRSREALKILGLENIIPVKKYDLSGNEYERFNAILKEIAAILKSKEIPSPNLLDVDLFLYYVVATAKKTETPEMETEEEFDHDEIKEMLLQIGQGLGFEVDSEVPLAPGTKVDVIWRAKIGNLGEVKYVFEVHREGSIDSLLLNLIKAQSDSTVQKIIAVSDEKRLNNIRREVSSLPQLSDRLIYWTVSEVKRAAELLGELKEIMEKLELVKI